MCCGVKNLASREPWPLPSSLRSLVAGPGDAPGLGDYEPPVQLYTTPHVRNEANCITLGAQKIALASAYK